MRVFRQLLFGSCIFALLFTIAPGARASEWDQKVIATFSAPFEIPGQVLPTGTYVFKVVDIIGTRDVVRVTNRDESKILATAITVTRYRPNPTDKPSFVFEERGADSPQALQAWFYPGRISGHQFIYRGSMAREAMTASMPATPAPSSESATYPASDAEESPVMSAEATPSEVESTPSAESQATETQAPATTTSTSQAELPKTASTMPLIALIGTLLLGGALGFKILASRVS
jgi:hypothetical protein